MTALAQIFNELMYGSGFWLMFVVIAVICISASYRFKYSGLIFEIVMFFLAMEYNNNLLGSDSKMWGIILCFVAMIFIGLRLYGDMNRK